MEIQDRVEAGQRLRAFIVTALGTRGETLRIAGLARAADVQRQTVHRWFAGTASPSNETLGRIAAYIDAPPADLVNVYYGPAAAPVEDLEAILRRVIREELAAISARLDLVAAAGEGIDQGRTMAIAEVEEADRPPANRPRGRARGPRRGTGSGSPRGGKDR